MRFPLLPGDRFLAGEGEEGPEHCWICPCGNWQIHISEKTVSELANLQSTVTEILWEHELECPVLQHAFVQAGQVRL